MSVKGAFIALTYTSLFRINPPYEGGIILFMDEEDVFEKQLPLRPRQIAEPNLTEKLVSSPL